MNFDLEDVNIAVIHNQQKIVFARLGCGYITTSGQKRSLVEGMGQFLLSDSTEDFSVRICALETTTCDIVAIYQRMHNAIKEGVRPKEKEDELLNSWKMLLGQRMKRLLQFGTTSNHILAFTLTSDLQQSLFENKVVEAYDPKWEWDMQTTILKCVTEHSYPQLMMGTVDCLKQLLSSPLKSKVSITQPDDVEDLFLDRIHSLKNGMVEQIVNVQVTKHKL